jgi:hypothetical protein
MALINIPLEPRRLSGQRLGNAGVLETYFARGNSVLEFAPAQIEHLRGSLAG